MKPGEARPELEALARQDYRRAISLLEGQVTARPDDLEAQLELGLTHMLAGDEEQFAAIHQRVAARMKPGRPRGRLARLWALSVSYFERLMQAAAAAALLAGAGCERARYEPAEPSTSLWASGRPVEQPLHAAVHGRPKLKYGVQRPRPVTLPDGGATDDALPRTKYGVERPQPVTLPDAGALEGAVPLIRPDTETMAKYAVRPAPRYMVRRAPKP